MVQVLVKERSGMVLISLRYMAFKVGFACPREEDQGPPTRGVRVRVKYRTKTGVK